MSAEPIGHVEAATQRVEVERADGSITPLAVGDSIYQDDTIVTGPLGAVQIVFTDGTTFALGEGARLTIDSLIYDPAGSDNGLVATLAEGSFVFLTGAIAPAPGIGIQVDTPVGTMGIRGTFGGGGRQTPWDTWTIALFPEVDGSVGKIVFTNAAGEVVLEEPFDALDLPGFESITEPTTISVEDAMKVFAAALNVGVDDLLKLPQVKKYNEDSGYEDLNTGSGGFGRLGDLFQGGLLGGSLDPSLLRLLALLRLLEHGTVEETKTKPNTPPPFEPDDDTPPPDDKEEEPEPEPVVFSINGPTAVTEGGTGLYTVSYTGATLAPGQTATITVATGNLAGGDPNATAGVDYTSLSTVLTFTSGTGTSQTVAVSTIDDTVVEGNEDYAVTLSGPNGGTLATSQANTAIADDGDSSLLQWSIAGSTEVTEGGTGLYTVSYTGATLAAGQTATITVATGNLAGGDPNAIAGSDYTALSTVLVFTSGTGTSQTVAVSTIDDTVVESNEDYAVTLSGQSAGSLATSQANTAIADDGDSSLLQWSIAGSTEVTEGGTGLYTVSYAGATLAAGQTATITVATGNLAGGDPNAIAGSDYTALSTVLVFTSGTGTSQTVAVSTIDDTVVEGNEDYAVTLSGQSAGSLAASQANTAIADDGDSSLLQWSIAGSTEVTEGGTGLYTVSYAGATLAAGQTATITVASGNLAGGDPNAIAGSDYTALSTVLTFTSGTGTSRTVAVSTIDDTVVEGNEDYAVTLSGQSAGSLAASQANTAIADDGDSSLLQWSIAGSTEVTEGGTGLYTVSYTGATLAAGQTATITVATGNLAGGDPNAIAGSDYTALSTVLVFTSGTGTSQTVAVSTIDDTVVEGNEDYAVTLSGPNGGTLATSQANTAIADDGDSSLLQWSIAGSTEVTEGGTGLYTVSYTGATLAAGQTATITVATGNLAGGDPNAIAGSDYTALSTVLVFTSGTGTSQTVAVSTIDDTVVEGNEDYAVTLSGPNGGTLATSQANTAIADDGDSSLLQWSIAGSTEVTEGGTGLYTVSYTGATLAAGQSATITVATGNLAGGDPNAIAGSDYTALSTVLVFTSGTGTSQTVAVSTIDDTVVEGNEDYAVTLSGQSAGSLAASQANTAIADDGDSSLLQWSIAGSTAVTEGGTGLYTVSYAGATLAAGQSATITVATGNLADGDPNATAGVDYTSLSTVLTFTSGTGTSQTVAVSTIDDTVVEGNEDYAVTLSGPNGGTLATSQANTAIADDGDSSLLQWSIAGSTAVTEGGTGLYTVSYAGATLAAGQTATITVASGNLAGGDPNAIAGSDYTALSTVLTFTSGTGTSRTVAVSTIDDTVVEGNEDYAVTLSGQSAGSLAASQANTAIADDGDSSLLQWSVTGSTAVTEGGTGLYTVSYTGATLAAGQTATITVATGNLAGGDPNATAGVDYTSLSTVLTFTSGTGTSRTVAVSTIDDTVVEGNEDYAVTLSGPNGGTLATSQASTAIVDTGDALVFSLSGASVVVETAPAAAYTVSYTGATLAPGQTATVTVATASGWTTSFVDATAGSDFTALSTVLTFTAGGGTSQTVSVSIIDDTAAEGTEDFRVVLANPTNATLATSQVNTVIDDDETGRFLSGGTGQSNDTLIGGPGPDTIVGLGGEDSLLGNGGADSIIGGQEDDIAFGGDGNDTVSGDSGADTLLGGNGDDDVNGDQDNDSIMGDAGDDTLSGGSGSGLDTIRGGDGDDSLDGGAGSDTLVGDDGQDTLVGANNPDLLVGGNGNDSIMGGQSDDTIVAGDGNDAVDGGGGGDSILGGGGDDRITLDAADDRIDGGSGIDRLLLDGSSIDFDDLTDDQLSGIEIVDMNDSADNDITLDASDVLDFEAATGVVDGSSNPIDLVVTGEAGDSVTFDSDGGSAWNLTQSGLVLAGAYDGLSFDVYSDGDVVVAIQQGVAVS